MWRIFSVAFIPGVNSEAVEKKTKEEGADRKLTVIPMDQISALQSYPFSCSITYGSVLQRLKTASASLQSRPGMMDSDVNKASHLWGHPARCANKSARFHSPCIETTLIAQQHPPSRSQTDSGGAERHRLEFIVLLVILPTKYENR